MSKELLTVGIGDAGVYGTALGWRDSLASVSIPDTRFECYLHRLVEGGAAMDKRPAFKRDDAAAFRGVLGGPMLDPRFPKGTIDRLGGRVTVDTIVGQDCLSLAHVSLDLYEEYWRALGARIGRRAGDTIVWEDGDIEPIVVPSWAVAA